MKQSHVQLQHDFNTLYITSIVIIFVDIYFPQKVTYKSSMKTSLESFELITKNQNQSSLEQDHGYSEVKWISLIFHIFIFPQNKDITLFYIFIFPQDKDITPLLHFYIPTGQGYHPSFTFLYSHRTMQTSRSLTEMKTTY